MARLKTISLDPDPDAVMRAALDPDVGGALAAVLAHPLLYPLAALSYTGYLVSMITPAWA